MHNKLGWDIFCRVVDNFGDAGVCWRLARLLSDEHGGKVRLVIDDLGTLRRLHPEVRDEARQRVDGIDVVRWDADAAIDPEGVDVIVDAFGCGPPEAYLERAATLERRPLWIVLEYLSAEGWVEAHHGLASPHPRLALERYFFFPGFTKDTGGLLRERDLLARRDAFDANARARFWSELGHSPPPPAALTALVFAYRSAPVAELFSAWSAGPRRTVAVVPEGDLAARALQFFGAESVPPGRVLTRGALEARFIPFIPQARFDELLWACDVNFVRGEDSIVRAQWAGRPFVWHIYVQQEEAHRLKLEALLDAYCAGLPEAAAGAVRDLSLAWNGLAARTGSSAASAWTSFEAALPALNSHGPGWAGRLVQAGELAANLARFCFGKLK